MRVKTKFTCKRGDRAFSVVAHVARYMATSHGQGTARNVALLGAKKSDKAVHQRSRRSLG